MISTEKPGKEGTVTQETSTVMPTSTVMSTSTSTSTTSTDQLWLAAQYSDIRGGVYWINGSELINTKLGERKTGNITCVSVETCNIFFENCSKDLPTLCKTDENSDYDENNENYSYTKFKNFLSPIFLIAVFEKYYK
ncbi:hypothetical protein Anas_12637 [Armadillidium nasatum]|uniref:C-type lectin domain-containing protein n=1 Tax=Armadillidium nasatum TaxID=96803 RepID=A0A5N5T0J7_9CRUS|nr:hypothetical protein Anas_12637 [Armadillidium nasatum]